MSRLSNELGEDQTRELGLPARPVLWEDRLESKDTYVSHEH